MSNLGKNLQIGMIDSGVGGLSILNNVHELTPDLEVFYIADKRFSPYGEKTEKELTKRAITLTESLLSKNVKLITLACNTLTAAAIKTLRKEFNIPFVGVEPYLNAFNKELELEDLSKLGVLTTKYTGSSEKFWTLKNKLDPFNKIVHQSSDKLAMLIENIYETEFNEEKKELIKKELSPLKDRGFSHIILGCTHYPLISEFIEEYLNVKCIASGKHIALRIEDILNKDFAYQRSKVKLNNFWYMDTSIDYWKKALHKKIELLK